MGLLIVRQFEEKDAKAVSALIAATLKTTNKKDYSDEYLEDVIRRLQPEDIVARAGGQHFYVAEENRRIVGCGSIGSYWGKEDESSLFTVFVLPECQGKGVGRKIVETLEQDEYALRAKRIEIPASITGLPFYQKLGYTFKEGRAQVDDEGLYRLEKFR
jgi:N-acetylglutamate synthase-like GNAT family acetyltransferase